VAGQIQDLLSDLSTLTEFEPSDWRWRYQDQNHDWNEDAFAKIVPCTPNEYRRVHDEDLNDVRSAAGIPTKKIHEPTDESRALQSLAGIR
jgi:hypothetical protein